MGIILNVTNTCVPALPNSVGNSLPIIRTERIHFANPELHMHHINFKEFALKPSLQNLHDGNKLYTKVSNHEMIRIPYQSEDQN